MNISVTEKARQMLQSKLQSGQFLRVMVVEGGCAGLTYSAAIDRQMSEEDTVIQQIDNVRIVSEKSGLRYLDGLMIDYSDDLIAGGLRLTNANAKSTCSCGSSFRLAGFPVIEGGKCSK